MATPLCRSHISTRLSSWRTSHKWARSALCLATPARLSSRSVAAPHRRWSWLAAQPRLLWRPCRSLPAPAAGRRDLRYDPRGLLYGQAVRGRYRRVLQGAQPCPHAHPHHLPLNPGAHLPLPPTASPHLHPRPRPCPRPDPHPHPHPALLALALRRPDDVHGLALSSRRLAAFRWATSCTLARRSCCRFSDFSRNPRARAAARAAAKARAAARARAGVGRGAAMQAGRGAAAAAVRGRGR